MQIRFYNCHDDSPSQSSRAIEITKDKFEKYSTLRIDLLYKKVIYQQQENEQRQQ